MEKRGKKGNAQLHGSVSEWERTEQEEEGINVRPKLNFPIFWTV